jgi:membrane associated rhomboid family serine protease
MIPLRDHNPSNNAPWVTRVLIALNVVVFGYMFLLPVTVLEQLVFRLALIPAEIVQGIDMYTLITSMFLHASLGHIIGNMLFLNIFGDNLEDYLGHFLYLIYYLASGLGGALLQIFFDPTSTIPNLGASGAIAGLMGGYLVLFPRHRVDILLPLGFFFHQTTVPAFTMLLYWVIFQLFGGLVSFGLPGGVAYWAHIGGFVTGVLLIYIFRALLPKTVSTLYEPRI